MVTNQPHYEIERKYLIRYPDTKCLQESGADVWRISQTYLLGKPGVTARVRSVVCGGECTCYYTEKTRISGQKCMEEETVISGETYRALLEKRDPTRKTIEKTRYRLPYDGHMIEIDVYPFWQDRAIMEIELSAENETFSLPKDISVIRDVTDDSRYKNAALAYQIVAEPIW